MHNTLGQRDVAHNIFVQSQSFEIVDTFVFPGSIITRDGSWDPEINRSIKKASKEKVFGQTEASSSTIKSVSTNRVS